MERLYDFRITRRELEEIMAAATKVWKKGIEPEALAVITGINNKAALLFAYMDAKEAEAQASKVWSKAKKTRFRAQTAYNNAVEIDKAGADDIERDADGIPVLTFDEEQD